MANTDPFRLRVLKALTAALGEITVANGYNFDLAGKVFRGRDVFGASDPLPMLSILESMNEKDQSISPQAGTVITGPWELLIQGWSADDEDNPTDPSHFLLADVKKRLVQERSRARGYEILGMGGMITDIKFSTGVVRPADEVSSKAYFWLKLELVLVENLADPYA
jgi:hypothetical protein